MTASPVITCVTNHPQACVRAEITQVYRRDRESAAAAADEDESTGKDGAARSESGSHGYHLQVAGVSTEPDYQVKGWTSNI